MPKRSQQFNQLAAQVLAMFKDSSKLAVEFMVQVRPCSGSHAHFDLSCPFVADSRMFDSIAKRMLEDSFSSPTQLVDGSYTLRQSILGGTEFVTVPEGTDEATKQFLLKHLLVPMNDMLLNLRAGFAEWPNEVRTIQALKGGYSQVLRNKIWFGSNDKPIQVRVMRESELAVKQFVQVLGGLAGMREQPEREAIELNVFDGRNPCVEVLRAAFELYANDLLTTKVEPALFPVIAERVNKLLDSYAMRLAQAQASSKDTTTDPTGTAVGASDDESDQVTPGTTMAPEAVSGQTTAGTTEAQDGSKPNGQVATPAA